jgi:peptidoglycan/xylan/chitin deacetylase (PgdA/CDA1 family)
VARIALKVDVDTLRGTREGVPRLLDALAKAGARATFLWSLGPDHTGWALRRIFRPGFFAKVSRTSVLEHYGLKTLLYGVLLPAPDIGREAAAVMRSVRDAGHECGIHTWDHVLWQDNVRRRDRAWTERQMRFAFERFSAIFGTPPSTHGAAGWQMNPDAFRQLDAWGLAYASDGRGTAPYVPRVDGRTLSHVQLPTTLATFDELLGVDGRDEDAVVAEILRATSGATDQVFTLHAELEGGRLAPAFGALLEGWRHQGHRLVTLGELYAGLDPKALPVRSPQWGTVPGRSGELVV